MAKFSNCSKDLSAKSKTPYSELKNVKLQPLATLRNKSKSYIPPTSPKTASKLSTTHQSKRPSRSSTPETFSKCPKLSREARLSFWSNFASNLLNRSPVELQNTLAYNKLLLLKKILKRGVRLIQIRRRTKIQKVSRIQTWWKAFLCQKQYSAFKTAATTIQKYWKYTRSERILFKKKVKAIRTIQSYFRNCRPSRLLYLKIKKAAFVCSSFAKSLFGKKTLSATVIQKHYKGYLARKNHRPAILNALKARKHKQFLRKQRELAELRNTRKKAVRVIENEYLKYKYRLRLKELRKYLWTIPYECRLLYLKFKQVKRDADLLKADVEQMILAKQNAS